MKYTICHLSTGHNADDVRIFFKECISLSKVKNYKVIICAPGSIPPGSGVIHFKISNPVSSRLIRFINSQLIFLKLIFKIRADVWHIHDPELLPVAVILTYMKRRVIWDSHEDYYLQFKSNINYRKYIPNYLRPIFRYTVYFLLNRIDQKAAGIVGPSVSIIEKYSNPNVKLVGNEALLKDFSSCAPKFKNNTVLFIGQLDSSHCYREIVDAVFDIPELKLVVATKVFNKREIDYSSLILNHRFQYLGWLDRENLSAAISDSSVGLVTYNYNLNHSDNQPNKFYEFCAAGLPILATPTLFNNNLIKNSKAGVLTSGYESKSIKIALLELLSSEKYWLNCSESGRDWAKINGSWAESESSLLKLYAKVLENN
jgi:glycosyltransferase involved in cell wall biosynthesis